MPVSRRDSSAGVAISPFKIHVSSRYLKITRKKLELTRLPHENMGTRARGGWDSKAEVESLIDYWLDQYSWREHEHHLNETLPQFRARLHIPGLKSFARVHFIHQRSPHPGAVPLLLIPPFPFSNLSFERLIRQLTHPETEGGDTTASSHAPAFHVVVPSLPGIGFSDALPASATLVPTTAALLDRLMRRLGYTAYFASNSGTAAEAAAGIDWAIVHTLATRYPSTCLGAHFIAPPVGAPRVVSSPWEWAKWRVASTLRVGALGYEREDFAALKNSSRKAHNAAGKPPKTPPASKASLAETLWRCSVDPLAYALCDSPTGLLLYILSILRGRTSADVFTPDDIITFTLLAWLPGPEEVLRTWTQFADAVPFRAQIDMSTPKTPTHKARVGLTVFLGHHGKKRRGALLSHAERYVCPQWAASHYTLVSAHRVRGRAGLAAWERPAVLAAGVRDFVARSIGCDTGVGADGADGTGVVEVEGIGEEWRGEMWGMGWSSGSGSASPSGSISGGLGSFLGSLTGSPSGSRRGSLNTGRVS